jgi:hypothetical protein
MTWTTIKLYVKGALRSWTIHFNAWLLAVWAVLPSLQEYFPQIQGYLPAKPYQYGMLIIIVGNILLRFKTKQPLAAKVPAA